MTVQDVIIVGAGPAGISCAIQLKRHGINPILLEKNRIGGLIINANRIENYLGFPEGISGFKYATLLKKQLEKHRIEIHFDEVREVDYHDFLFHITTNKRKLTSINLVLATGTISKLLSLPEVPMEAEHLVKYEIKDILHIRNKNVAIIGAGDAAFDYALNLAKNNKVCILNRTNVLRCLPLLNDECDKNPNIKYFTNSIVESLEFEKNMLKLICSCDGEIKTRNVSYLIAAIGREPNYDILSEQIITSYHDLIAANRLFPIGDINNGRHRQLSICTGEGIKAAMQIFEEINF